MNGFLIIREFLSVYFYDGYVSCCDYIIMQMFITASSVTVSRSSGFNFQSRLWVTQGEERGIIDISASLERMLCVAQGRQNTTIIIDHLTSKGRSIWFPVRFRKFNFCFRWKPRHFFCRRWCDFFSSFYCKILNTLIRIKFGLNMEYALCVG